MDRQTDGIAVASTALAMRALRRAVKTDLVPVYAVRRTGAYRYKLVGVYRPFSAQIRLYQKRADRYKSITIIVEQKVKLYKLGPKK